MTSLEPTAAAVKPPLPRKEPEFRVESVTVGELPTRVREWDALAESALVANPFYESWMLRPALDAFADPATFQAVLVYRDSADGRPLLVGLFPCERIARHRGLRCRGLALWKHQHGVLCTPLLHRDHAAQALGAFFDWAGRDPRGGRILDFELVDAERAFAHVLTDVLNSRKLVNLIDDQFNRAFLRARPTAEQYLAAALSSRHRQEYRRQRRRLGDLGAVESRVLGDDEPVEPWLEAFFRLEASGWKGAEKTAFAARPQESRFFRDVILSAHAAGRLHMLGLFLSGEPIALKINFLSGGGAFALKIAYDEKYAKYSPGVLLEIDNMEAVHASRNIGWMDSCACANHPMIDRLWLDRRAIQRRVISTGSRWANVVIGLTSLGRAIKRTLKR